MPTVVLSHGIIGDSISNRANWASEFAKKIAAQNERDQDIKAALFALVPEELRDWIDSGILESLFACGKRGTKIDFYGNYGFKDQDDVKTKITKLKKVWKDMVTIELGNLEARRIEVTFAAIM